MIADVEDADEEFLGRIARRHLGLPWAICETERLKIREIAEGDYEEIVENHVDAGLDTVEKVAVTQSTIMRCLSLDSGRSRKRRAEISPVLWVPDPAG